MFSFVDEKRWYAYWLMYAEVCMCAFTKWLMCAKVCICAFTKWLMCAKVCMCAFTKWLMCAKVCMCAFTKRTRLQVAMTSPLLLILLLVHYCQKIVVMTWWLPLSLLQYLCHWYRRKKKNMYYSDLLCYDRAKTPCSSNLCYTFTE